MNKTRPVENEAADLILLILAINGGTMNAIALKLEFLQMIKDHGTVHAALAAAKREWRPPEGTPWHVPA